MKNEALRYVPTYKCDILFLKYASSIDYPQQKEFTIQW